MKSFKYLLVLPFAITALASCNKGNFSPTDFDNAKAMVENYAKSIKNSKASSITVGGHINEIKIKGDATWWSFTEPDEPKRNKEPSKLAKVYGEGLGAEPFDPGMLSMIPNFSVEDSEIVVDSQDIVSFTLPGSIVSIGDSALPTDEMAFLVAANLPRFPMNNNLLSVINGIKDLPEEMTEEAWEEAVKNSEPWKNAEVKYYADGGRLKVTVETKDVETFFAEVSERYMKKKVSYNADPEPTKKYPGSFSITTSKIGYIDSFSVKFKVEGAKYEPIDPKEASAYYIYLNGDISLDFGLTFKQTVSTPITLKYQLSAYHPTGKDETPDLEYPINGEMTPLTYDKDKSKPLTTTLDDFKDYLTFDWYKNVKPGESIEGEVQPSKLTTTFDDPIFCCNYWNDNAKNIAFTNEIYDIIAIPTLYADSKEPKCAVLGGEFHDFGVQPTINTHVSTSINGRVVSENGLLRGAQKTLNAAADAVQQIYDKDNNLLSMDEIFVNSTLLNTEYSEYIVNISIVVLPQE